MGEGGVERSGERHQDRGKSSLARKPGSKIGEPEERKSVRATSNQGKLREAIAGRQNRAFFGRSGCRWGMPGVQRPWHVWQHHLDLRGREVRTIY